MYDGVTVASAPVLKSHCEPAARSGGKRESSEEVERVIDGQLWTRGDPDSRVDRCGALERFEQIQVRRRQVSRRLALSIIHWQGLAVEALLLFCSRIVSIQVPLLQCNVSRACFELDATPDAVRFCVWRYINACSSSITLQHNKISCNPPRRKGGRTFVHPSLTVQRANLGPLRYASAACTHLLLALTGPSTLGFIASIATPRRHDELAQPANRLARRKDSYGWWSVA